MLANNPRGLVLVALLQFVTVILLPPDTLVGMVASPAIAFVLVLFGVLGVALLRRRAWSRLATVFVQGMNIIVRLLIGVAGAAEGGAPQFGMLATSLVSIALSVLILYYVDQPEVQMIMQ